MESKNYLVSSGTDEAPELLPTVMCSSPDCIQANWLVAVVGISMWDKAEALNKLHLHHSNIRFFNLPAFCGSDAGVVWPCELCPFTFKSDLPRKPNRISISVGYGRRRSPCCHVSGAEIAFDALILCEGRNIYKNSLELSERSMRKQWIHTHTGMRIWWVLRKQPDVYRPSQCWPTFVVLETRHAIKFPPNLSVDVASA